MARGKLQEKNSLFMRVHIGDGVNPDNNEKIQLSTTMSGAPCVSYKGRFVVWEWNDLVDEAVNLIDDVEEVDTDEN